jgi:hypothetical protein
MATRLVLHRLSATASRTQAAHSLTTLRASVGSRSKYLSLSQRRAASTHVDVAEALADAAKPSSAKPAGTNARASPFPSDEPPTSTDGQTDWSKSYQGLSQEPFPKEIAETLMAPVDTLDVEIKPGNVTNAILRPCRR